MNFIFLLHIICETLGFWGFGVLGFWVTERSAAKPQPTSMEHGGWKEGIRSPSPRPSPPREGEKPTKRVVFISALFVFSAVKLIFRVLRVFRGFNCLPGIYPCNPCHPW